MAWLTFRHLQPMDVRSTAAADGCCSAWSLSVCILVYDGSVLKYVFFLYSLFMPWSSVICWFTWFSVNSDFSLTNKISLHLTSGRYFNSCYWILVLMETFYYRDRSKSMLHMLFVSTDIRAIRQLLWARKWCNMFSFALVSHGTCWECTNCIRNICAAHGRITTSESELVSVLVVIHCSGQSPGMNVWWS